jgi:chemotaxis protein MotB
MRIDSEGSWAISYGDMVTLLLAFFILFFSVDPQVSKQKELDRSLRSDILSEFSDQERSLASPEVSIKSPKLSGEKVVIHSIESKLLVEFPGVSFYRSGDIKVTEGGKRSLQRFSKKFMPYAGQYRLGIRAYTDSRRVLLKAKRRFKDNLELSALRSIAAMRILQRSGIPLKRMRLGGYGEMMITARELASLKDKSEDSKLALARTVVLVIEPEAKSS